MKHNTLSAPIQSTEMKKSTFNFLVDTLYEEILMHDHKDELLTLMAAQVTDDTCWQHLIASSYLGICTMRTIHGYGVLDKYFGAAWNV